MRVDRRHTRTILLIGVLAALVATASGCALIERLFGGRNSQPREHTDLQTPRRFRYTEEQCVGAFLEGNQVYRKYKRTSPLHTSSFEMARGFFETALAKCQNWEYEDDALSSLASCCFYTGEFEEAARCYRRLAERFPYSDFNMNDYCRDEARFLEACSSDEAMDCFRRGGLYELARKYDLAAAEYAQAIMTAGCNELRERCEARLRDVRRRGP